MLYAFGSNGNGQLGIGSTEDISKPTKCSLPEDAHDAYPVTVTAGGNHTLVLMSNGQLYAAGSCEDGRCGSIDWGRGMDRADAQATNILSFRRLAISQDAIHDHEANSKLGPSALCAASWEASYFVHENYLFSCGSGSKGELGQGEDVIVSTDHRRVLHFPPVGTEIIDIAACVSHVVAVLSNGEVYGWGSGRKGQIGEPAEICWQPRKIEGINFKAARAVCGRDFTYIVSQPSEGAHLVLGSNKFGIRAQAPDSIYDWKSIGASWGSIYVLLDTGSLIAWGRNDHGQLPPAGLPKLQQIAVGSEHVIAGTESGKVIAWGWGEHGNCGTPMAEGGDVKDGFNTLRVPGQVLFIGAGCATSWTFAIHDEQSDQKDEDADELRDPRLPDVNLGYGSL